MKTILFIAVALAVVYSAVTDANTNVDGACNAETLAVVPATHHSISINGNAYCISANAMKQLPEIKALATKEGILGASNEESDNSLSLALTLETNKCGDSNDQPCFTNADSLFKVELFNSKGTPEQILDGGATFTSASASFSEATINDEAVGTIFTDSEGKRQTVVKLVISFKDISVPADAKVFEQDITIDVTLTPSPNVIGLYGNTGPAFTVGSISETATKAGDIQRQVPVTVTLHNDAFADDSAPASISIGDDLYIQLKANEVNDKQWSAAHTKLYLVVNDQDTPIEITEITEQNSVDVGTSPVVDYALRIKTPINYIGTYTLKIQAKTQEARRRLLEEESNEVVATLPITVLPKEQPSYSVVLLSAVAAVLVASAVLLYSRNRKALNYSQVESNDIKA